MRIFVLIFVVSILKTTIFVVQGCSGCENKQSEAFYLIPGASDVVINVNLESVLADVNFQKALIKKNRYKKDFTSLITYLKTEAGLDISLLKKAAMFIDISESKSMPTSGALILKGIFDKKKVLEAINKTKKKKAILKESKGYVLIDVNKSTQVAILGNQYLVIGPVDGVEKVVKKYNGHDGDVNPMLKQIYVTKPGNIFQLAAVLPKGFKSEMASTVKNEELKNIINIVAKLSKAGEKYILNIAVKCSSNNAVKIISLGVQGLVLIGKGSKKTGFESLLNKLKITEKGDFLMIDIDVPPELLSELIPGSPTVRIP